MKTLIFTLLLYAFCLSNIYGQTSKELKNEIKIEKKAAKDSAKQEKIDQGKFIISPLIVPGYTPETISGEIINLP